MILSLTKKHFALPATSINLGVIEGIGYLVEHDYGHKQLTRNLDTWAPINEANLRRVCYEL